MNSPTPILDSGVLPTVMLRRRERAFKILPAFVLGFVLILAISARADKGRDSIVGFILLASALTLTTVVHECGHLFAGWAVGVRFSVIHIGPFSLRLKHGKLKVRARREMLAVGAAGMHVKTVRRLRRRLLIYVAGGPAANLLSIPATVILVNHVFPGLGETRVGTLAAQFTVFSLLAGLVNLMPNRSVLQSEGARIEMLLRSCDRSKRWLSIAAIGNLYDRGIRAKDWKRTWLKSAAAVQDASLDDFIGNWLAYASANDKKDAFLAAGHLERCLELSHTVPPSIRGP